MLKIADQVFEIDSSRFSGHVSLCQRGWGVSWSLEFVAEEKDVNDMDWKPHIIPHAFSVDFPSPRKLSGFRTRLPDCDENEEPMFLLYVFEHEPLREVMLGFGDWHQNRIQFNLTGVADVYADDQYQDNLAVEISLLLPFDGVVVDEGRIDKAIEKFATFFDIADFSPPESRGDRGGFVFRPAII